MVTMLVAGALVMTMTTGVVAMVLRAAVLVVTMVDLVVFVASVMMPLRRM